MPEKRKVRRCLFGRPNPDVLKKELEKLLDIHDGKQKWNFDFAEDKPLNNGRFQWTKVKDDCYVPEFYRKGYSTRTKTFRELRSSGELHSQPIVPRPTNQLDTLPHGNNTNHCAPCVTKTTDVRTDIESHHNDVDEASSETCVCSSNSNTTACNDSPVQSTITGK